MIEQNKFLNPYGILARWANHVRGFYGHPVYLVGSALTKEEPRDIDVICILPDEEFKHRYGIKNIEQFFRDKILGDFSKPHWNLVDDYLKKTKHGWRFTKMNIDFKVKAEYENKNFHYTSKKEILDTKNIKL